MSDLNSALEALKIANKRIDELEKYNLDLANESHNKSSRIEQLERENVELIKQNDKLLENGRNSFGKIQALKQERDELAESVDRFAAMFGRLRSAINRIDSPATGYCEAAIHEVFNLIEQTPQTSLAEVRAKQAFDSYQTGYEDAADHVSLEGYDYVLDGGNSHKHADEHAQQIRNGD